MALKRYCIHMDIAARLAIWHTWGPHADGSDALMAPHTFDGIECWCGPRVEWVENQDTDRTPGLGLEGLHAVYHRNIPCPHDGT